MSNQPSTHENLITVNVNNETVAGTIRAALNEQFQEALSDVELRYEDLLLDSGLGAFEISINFDYRFRELDGGSNAVIARGKSPLRIEVVRRSSATVSTTNQDATDVQPDETDAQELYDSDWQSEEIDIHELYTEAAERVLPFFDTIDLNDLTQDNKSCPVCMEPFSLSDRPTALKCKHIVGRACLEHWISGCHNSCPMCRAEIFDPQHVNPDRPPGIIIDGWAYA